MSPDFNEFDLWCGRILTEIKNPARVMVRIDYAERIEVREMALVEEVKLSAGRLDFPSKLRDRVHRIIARYEGNGIPRGCFDTNAEVVSSMREMGRELREVFAACPWTP